MTVLVSYIPTQAGFIALGEAMVQAGFRGVPLVVLNVGLAGNAADVTFADEQHLDSVADRLDREGIGYEIRQIVDSTDVAETVLSIAEEVHAQLIVLALRRRSRVGKLLLGSNAQRMILQADCPVLSVREPD